MPQHRCARAARPTSSAARSRRSWACPTRSPAARTCARMLQDLAALPTDQREALVLAELHDNSHAQVAEILGCAQNKVKSLVFQARTSLMQSREAREVRCEEVQSQLSVLRGGSLRRTVLRRHLAECEACRLFGAEVKRQRAALAMVLPVMPDGRAEARRGECVRGHRRDHRVHRRAPRAPLGVGRRHRGKARSPRHALEGSRHHTRRDDRRGRRRGHHRGGRAGRDARLAAPDHPEGSASPTAHGRPERGAARRRPGALRGSGVARHCPASPLDKLRPDKSLAPGLSKPANGAAGPPRAHPQKPGSHR